jgi:hypothetical protein
LTHRRILLVLGAALVVTTIAYLMVRDPSPDPRELAAVGDNPTSSSSTTSTRSAAVVGDTTSTTRTLTTATAPEAGGGSPAATSVGPATAAGSSETPTTAGTAATTAVPQAAGATTTTTPAPPFRSSVGPVTAAELGASWHDGCPIGVEDLRSVKVSHWGYDGQEHLGEVVVAASRSGAVIAALRDVYEARFPIEAMVPVARYGGDDEASMRANNTSAFNCRFVAGTTTWSEHSYGAAIDINPLVNPYVKGGTVDPPEGAPYADRRRQDQGMIHDGDAVVRAFAAQGWRWGGYWSSGQDYQHFSASGR